MYTKGYANFLCNKKKKQIQCERCMQKLPNKSMPQPPPSYLILPKGATSTDFAAPNLKNQAVVGKIGIIWQRY